ncbi:MAG: pimeloyl-ACP methyl ester esterase BioH [Gammaproteobacteria bacterium]|nr:pimeloyl-ACP methyl ester esterase BioH [Gammaproteobacteria bacterium]
MLHIEQQGAGADVVLVHGWGLHGGVWSSVAERLAHRFRVTRVDLPGHGRSPMPQQPFTLPTLVDALLAVCPPRAVWVGWSLGGLAAMAAALQRPEAIARLVLVAATPHFVCSDDWPHGMAPEVFAEFKRDIEVDSARTLRRFLSLQFGSSDAERAGLRQLRRALMQHGAPALAALRAGLAILQTADLRAALSRIDVPTLVMHGAEDRLTPISTGDYLVRTLPRARLQRFADAGHAPFLSQADKFIETIEKFLND